MKHENQMVISSWSARNYAEAYRDYTNNFFLMQNWFSSFMPEDENDETIYSFYLLCEEFHKLGF